MKQIMLADDDWEILKYILLGLKINGTAKMFPEFENILASVRDGAEDVNIKENKNETENS